MFSDSLFVTWPVYCLFYLLILKLKDHLLWETVGKVDWSDAYWGFFSNQYTSAFESFGILQILLVFTYCILLFGL